MTRAYLSQLPAAIPPGVALVHTSVHPNRRLGTRGFRAWLQTPGTEPHRVAGDGSNNP